jgi:glyoxylase-like metal-dependent hydrolase (beta-lactamase superfamily II)
MKSLITILFLILFTGNIFPQVQNIYDVYAIEYTQGTNRVPVKTIAINSQSPDTISFSFYFWYLKGDNGKKILVDAGFIMDSTAPNNAYKNYRRPDIALQGLGIKPDEITDIIITHTHYDHIDGIDLFPKATIWMQKNDYDYFVGGAWQKGANNLGLNKRDVLKTVQANLDGRLKLVDGDSLEIIPGIRVFIGSKHTYECQHLLVNTKSEKVMLASDDAWFYYNIKDELSIPLVFDQQAYIKQIKRMKSLVSNQDLIIPGHDVLVLSKFKQVAKGIVRIK